MPFIQRLGQLRSPVSTYANLPLTGNVLGDVRLSTDTGDAYTWMLEASSGLITNWKKVTTSAYNDLVGAPVSTGLDVDNAVKSIVGMSINIAYLGFQVLAEYLSSVARMFDGIIDRFADELGIQSESNALYSGYISNQENIKYFLPNKGDLDIGTKLLLHGDGVQGSSDFADLLRVKFTNYGVITDTTTKKFGTGSLKFDGVNDYIVFKDGNYENFAINLLNDYHLTNNPNGVAIDFWFNSNASGVQPIMSNGPISNLPGVVDPTFGDGEVFLITKNSSNKIEVTMQHGAWDSGLGQMVDAPLSVESTTVLSNSAWYHVAVQKNLSGYIKLYINGVLEATSSAFDLGAVMNTWPSCKFYIGKNGSTYLNGYLDEIRVSYAVRYTTTFTPMTKAYNTATVPVPTPVIVDISAGNKTVTALGNARMSGSNPLFGNASLYLDGINSYLTLADSNDWKLCDGAVLSEYVSDSYTKLLLHLNNNVTDEAGKSVTNNNVTFSTLNKFGSHAASFNGTSSYLSVPDSEDWNFGSGAFTIDLWVNFNSSSPSSYLVGQNNQGALYANLGVVGGQMYVTICPSAGGLYFYTNFTPTIGLWYHMALVRIDNGNSAASWRMFINGVSQSLTLGGGAWNNTYPNLSTPLLIGSEIDGYYHNGLIDEVRVSKGIARWTSNFDVNSLTDYTVDLWIDPLSLTDLNTYIIGQDDSWKLTLDGTSNKYLKYTIVGGASIIAPIALSLNTWHHVAIVQKDGILKLYVNGILGASITGSAIVNTATVLTIGATSTGTHLFNGFIEEVRISNSARWTAAFTPPEVEYSSDSNTKLLLPLNVQSVANMTLQSVGYVANYVPTSARVVIFEEDVDVMEPNVDLTIAVSRDGGATFTTCLIAKDQEFGDGTLNLFTGSVNLSSQPNGELMVWKLTTENNKDCRIRGVSLSWR